MIENIFWSDNWYIEDDSAWFVDGWRDILFCMNLKTNICEYVDKLPNSDSDKFRLNPRCLKIGNEIFCMPDLGHSIWIYNLESLKFSQIKIENPNKDRFFINGFWEYENKLFVLSIGLKKIIEIDVKKKEINNYYTLCDSTEEMIWGGVLVGHELYCVSNDSNLIYQFDLKSKKTIIHTIPNVKGGFRTITYDGSRFWISGYRKEIYVWNKESNTLEVIKDFPKQFGIYNLLDNGEDFLNCETTVYDTPAFIEAKAIGQYIWFIPLLTNNVIYADKDTHEIFTLEIENEVETEKSLKSRPLLCKYLIEYVKDNRYIGLFSMKNNYIVEIDTLEKKAEKINYTPSRKCLTDVLNKYGKSLFQENDAMDRELFKAGFLDKSTEAHDKTTGNVGLRIHEIISLE